MANHWKILQNVRYAFDIYEMASSRYKGVREKRLYKITILPGDPTYTKFLEYLSTAYSPRRISAGIDFVGDRPVLKSRFNETIEQTLSLVGHDVKVVLEAPKPLNYDARSPQPDSSPGLHLTMKSIKARNDVFDWIAKELVDETKGPRLATVGQWNEWAFKPIPRRDVDALSLKGEVKQAIIDDFEKFMNSEADYVKWGLPYRRGYLFYGPAGTGKTSLAASLATHFNLDVYFLNLSSIKDDKDLADYIGQINKRGLLVLEDVDVAHAAVSRSDEIAGVTLGGLLNCLDGFSTPDGLITVMTTNHIDRLDPALIRPGRADVKIELSYLNDEQFNKMVERFFGESIDMPSVENKQISPAEIVGIFKNYLHDPWAAEPEVRKHVEEK